MKRRNFLKKISAGAAAVVATPAIIASLPPAEPAEMLGFNPCMAGENLPDFYAELRKNSFVIYNRPKGIDDVWPLGSGYRPIENMYSQETA